LLDDRKSITDKIYCLENLPSPLFAKEGEIPLFLKGGKDGFIDHH
jgi:hypothetical protein